MQAQIKLGALAWLSALFFKRPPLNSHEWATLLTLLAALVWLPMALQFLGIGGGKPPSGLHIRQELLRWCLLPAALLLTLATFMETGWQAGVLALPWFTLSLLIVSMGLERVHRHLLSSPGELAIAAACLFLPIGSFSFLADRLGWQPLGFDPAIVLLTAAHFHYAGFLFTLLCGLGAQRFHQKKALGTAAYLAVLSVPLTAVGITVAHLWKEFLPEAVAASSVALAGWCCAAGYLQVAVREKIPFITKLLWTAMALALVFTMSLALLYALRPWMILDWLNIPSMRAWHGSVNALGVAGCGVLGWSFLQNGAFFDSRFKIDDI